MASRNEQKATDAMKALQDEADKRGSGKKLDLHFVPLDLMHIAGAKSCAEAFLAKEQRLDILVCNAGVMAVPYKLTDDGIEQQFQTNHLTHFALFNHLAPVMIKTAHQTGHPSRLVNLSSFAHTFIEYNPMLSFDFTSKDKVNRHMGFDQIGKYMRYSQSKLANILFAREVNQRYKPAEIRAVAVHPGFVASNLYKGTPLSPFAGKVFISSADGALSALMAATSPKLEQNNAWWVARVRGCMRHAIDDSPPTGTRTTAPTARRTATARRARTRSCARTCGRSASSSQAQQTAPRRRRSSPRRSCEIGPIEGRRRGGDGFFDVNISPRVARRLKDEYCP